MTGSTAGPAVSITEQAMQRAATTVISALAGPGSTVRADQLDAVRALVCDRRRALVVQATGWGKSAVYWIATRAVRDSGGGPVLVISPLLALMRDQVAAATRAGLRAVTLNSSNSDDWHDLESQLLAGDVDVLLVSPERLASPRFARDILGPLMPTLGLLVIDEAHCISSWGHDFRPDYQRIAALLLANPGLPVLATTATANARVTTDVASQLGDNTYVQRGELARTSLQLSVVPGLSPVQRYAWVDDALSSLSGSGIVYALTVAEANRLTDYLQSQGHEVRAYTGQMETGDRTEVESLLRDNAIKAVIATSALGMGYDKPDLAFCIHVGSPSSPVDYYQQVGRAGRSLPTAVVALLPGAGDARLWEWFATASVPDPVEAAALLSAMSDGSGPSGVVSLETSTGIRRSRVELLLKILAVDGAVDREVEGWILTGAPWAYDHVKYAALVSSRRHEGDLMRDYVQGARCLETVLRVCLDDTVEPDARCGRCSVCTGVLPSGLQPTASPAAIAAAGAFLQGIDVHIAPRKMWATGMANRRGRISSAQSNEIGRALAFADDPVWDQVGELLSTNIRDQEAPLWLTDGLTAVLARWSKEWVQRPVAVTWIPSRRKPVLIASLAAHLAAIGHLELIDPIKVTGPRPRPELSAAARARELEPTLTVRPEVPIPSGAILLIDDTTRSGWTLAIAGALLREHGASAVLPLIVHQLP
jgi:ATP-dependent DNA helicase RecQ